MSLDNVASYPAMHRAMSISQNNSNNENEYEEELPRGAKVKQRVLCRTMQKDAEGFNISRDKRRDERKRET